MTQTEVDWLKQSPAYSQAMEFLDAHWIKTKRGDYVSKQDLRDDQETTFEDMLAQMKLEGNQPPSDSLDDGEGGLTAGCREGGDGARARHRARRWRSA